MLFMYLFRHVFLKIYFEITKGSQKVAKIVHSHMYPSSTFPSGDTSYRWSIIPNKEIDVGTTPLTKLQIVFSFHHFYMHSFMCVYICVCLCACVCIVQLNFILCVDSCIHHNSQDSELFRYHQVTLSLYSCLP